VAALVVRPDFSRWPLPVYPVLVGLSGLSMAIGLLIGEAFAGAPEVFVFGLVAALMQVLMLLLPGALRPSRSCCCWQRAHQRSSRRAPTFRNR